MPLRAIARISLALFVLCTAGCVKNQLLRLEAKDFSTNATEATASGQTFYIDSVRSNQQLHALLFTLDARCVPPSLRSNEHPVPAPTGATSPAADFCLKLKSDLSYESFDDEFRSLDFVSSYVSALADAAADPKLVSADTFIQAAADFNTLASALKKKGISDDKVKAVSGLLSEIEKAAKDAESAKKIRGLFKDKGSEVQAQLESLADEMVDVQNDTDFDAAAAETIRQLAVSSMNNGTMDAQTRTQLLESIHAYQLEDWRRKREIAECETSKTVIEKNLTRFCRAKAAGLIYATAQAHQELGQLIADNPSPRQRQRRAALAYRQFIDLVSVFAGLRGAF